MTYRTKDYKKPTPRADLERLVWRHTHPDFRGTHVLIREDGREEHPRSVLHLIPGKGTCIVLIRDLSDAELQAKLPREVLTKWKSDWGIR